MLCSLGYYRLAPGGTLGIFGWGCAAGTLEPLAYTSIEPIYGSKPPRAPGRADYKDSNQLNAITYEQDNE